MTPISLNTVQKRNQTSQNNIEPVFAVQRVVFKLY